jgi:hypothetical protein
MADATGLDGVGSCGHDPKTASDGWDRGATGLVIVVTSFDAFPAVDRRTAQTMFDISASQAGASTSLATGSSA